MKFEPIALPRHSGVEGTPGRGNARRAAPVRSTRRARCCALALLAASSVALHAENHVLQLDGQGGQLALPAGLFDGLTQATVEAWFRVDQRRPAHVLQFGEARHELYVSYE